MGIHKTASGFRSEGLEKRQLLPAVKELRIGTKGSILVGKKKARNLCSCCSSLNNPTERGVMYSNSTLAGRREERAARKNTAIQKGCVYSQTVTQEKGRGARNRKEQSER